MDTIEARVIQKIATETEWLSYDFTPYKGEIMLVGDSAGKVYNLKVGDGVNKFADLNYAFDSIQQNVGYIAITSNALPTPSDEVAWGMVTEGTYTFGGKPSFTVPAGHWGIANYSSGSWSLVDMGELPTIPIGGVVEEGNPNAVSGGEVYDYVEERGFINESLLYEYTKPEVAALGGFLDEVEAIDLTNSVSGYLLRTNTVVPEGSPISNRVLMNIDTKRAAKLNTNMRRMSTSQASFERVASVLGVKNNGDIVVILPSFVGANSPIESLSFDVLDYDKVSICYNVSLGYTPSFSLVNSTAVNYGSVKEYIDTNNDLVLSNQHRLLSEYTKPAFAALGGFLDEVETIELTNSVSGYLLRTNTVVPEGNPISNRVLMNIDTKRAAKLNTNMRRMSTSQASFERVASVLGVKNNGDIVVILPSFVGANSPIESLSFDVLDYDKVSICYNVSLGYTPSFSLVNLTAVNYGSVKEYIDSDKDKILDNENRLNLLDKYNTGALVGNIFTANLNESANFKLVVNTTDPVFIRVTPSREQNIILNIYLDLQKKPASINMPINTTWQNLNNPTFYEGYQYFIMLQSFNGGGSWIASVVGFFRDKKTLAFDNFDREDNVDTMGSTLNGIIWQNTGSSVFGIKDKKPYAYIGSDPILVATIDVGSQNYIMTGVFTSARNKLIFRVKDRLNFSVFGLAQTGTQASVIAYNYVEGSVVSVASKYVASLSYYIIQVIVDEGTYRAYCNGELVFTRTLEDNLTETKVGIISGASAEAVDIINLSVTSL